MINKNKLRGKIIEMGYTFRAFSEKLGINEATLHRKMNGTSDFTRKEILKIATLLNLSLIEKEEIFFAD